MQQNATFVLELHSRGVRYRESLLYLLWLWGFVALRLRFGHWLHTELMETLPFAAPTWLLLLHPLPCLIPTTLEALPLGSAVLGKRWWGCGCVVRDGGWGATVVCKIDNFVCVNSDATYRPPWEFPLHSASCAPPPLPFPLPSLHHARPTNFPTWCMFSGRVRVYIANTYRWLHTLALRLELSVSIFMLLRVRNLTERQLMSEPVDTSHSLVHVAETKNKA